VRAARSVHRAVAREGTADVAGIVQHGDRYAARRAQRDQLRVAPCRAAVGRTL
jgi:hypothetical protein